MPRFSSLAVCLLLLSSLSATAVTMNGFNLDNATVPAREIHAGGPPRDGIPPIDKPRFDSADKASWLQDDDYVMGVLHNNVAKAYPIRVLVWHEIVNDEFNGAPLSITYCPLCGSGVVFDRRQADKVLDFGVSGLLYNSDMLLYDRQTESLWSQIPGKAISGPLSGQVLTRMPVSHTTWGDWRAAHPDSLVLNRETGHKRDYNADPYEGYERNYSLYFPVSERDRRYHPKELVLALAEEGKAKVWPFAELAETDGTVHDTFAGKPVVIRYDDRLQVARAFNADGEQLPATTLFWFAWYTFYPFTEVFTAPQGDAEK